MKTTVLFFLMCFGMLSCENNSKTTSESNAKSSNKNYAELPCEFLSEDEIKNILSIPKEAETTMKDKSRNYPSCFYKWESVSWEAKFMGYDTKFHPEMSIVFVDKANDEKYNKSISAYDDGVEEKGIGEKATWSKKMNQITILDKGKMVHIRSKTSEDPASNKEKTLKLAKLVLKKL